MVSLFRNGSRDVKVEVLMECKNSTELMRCKVPEEWDIQGKFGWLNDCQFCL